MRAGALTGALAVAASLAMAGLVSAQTPEDVLRTPPGVFNGSESAPHICSNGAFVERDGVEVPLPAQPCTAIFAPLPVSPTDRIEVFVRPEATAVTLDAVPCRSLGDGGWSCAPPRRSTGSQFEVSIRYPEGRSLWLVDVVALPRGRHATDRENGVRFRLAGRHLRVGLVPSRGSSPPRAARDVWGKRVKAVCAGRRARAGKRVRTVRWTVDAPTQAFWLPGRPLRAPRWCLIEELDGHDIALVRFPHRG